MASRLLGGLIGLLALFAGLVPSVAEAATLYITEFASSVSSSQSQLSQSLGQPAISTQTVVIGGASAQSSAFNSNTHGIQVYCDVGCSVVVGTNPTATTSSQVLTANQPMTFTVGLGQKIAVIANSSGTPTGAGGPVTIADGADVTQGAIADAAVVAGAAGTVNAHLRTISGQLPAALGQAVMASSLPVVIASNQSAFDTTSLPTATAANGLTAVVSSAAESNHVIKASAGNLYGFDVTTGATPGFVFVSNTTTAPTAGGAAITPVKCYVVAANSTIAVSYSPPLALGTGITLVFSSTGCFTNTASATAFISGDAK